MEEGEETSPTTDTNNGTNIETNNDTNNGTSKEGCVKCNGVSSTPKNDNEIVVLNVAGLKFKTKRGTLRRFPNTLLG